VADWKVYPFSIPAVAQLETSHFHPGVNFFVGENGSGKSTLVEAIACCGASVAMSKMKGSAR
jgi:predicted ATPase